MRKLGYVFIAIIAIAALIGITRAEELKRLMAVQTLFDEDRIVENFSNMDMLFNTVKMSRGDGPVSTPTTPRDTPRRARACPRPATPRRRGLPTVAAGAR